MYIAPICTPVPRLGFSQCVPLTGDIKVGRQSEVSLPGSVAGATSDDGHLGGGRRVAGQGTAHTGRGRGWRVGGGYGLSLMSGLGTVVIKARWVSHRASGPLPLRSIKGYCGVT